MIAILHSKWFQGLLAGPLLNTLSLYQAITGLPESEVWSRMLKLSTDLEIVDMSWLSENC